MTDQEHLRFRKGDVLAILLVVALAVFVAVCFIPKNSAEPVIAEVYQDGNLVQTLPLDQDTPLVIRGTYSNTVTVENGSVFISQSDCPGEDCVHSGAIRSSGRSLVCLPNALEVRVVTQTSDVDFVVG
jgi:hypothetical protein